MINEQTLRERLAEFKTEPWEGSVYRHMFNDIPPDRENTRGARWNPPNVAAIYTSLEHAAALAEANYRISLETVTMRPDLKRSIHKIYIVLHSVIDLGSMEKLTEVGIDAAMLSSTDLSLCQRVGEKVDWFEHDGLLVPSARHESINLVIYPSNRHADYVFEVVDSDYINR